MKARTHRLNPLSKLPEHNRAYPPIALMDVIVPVDIETRIDAPPKTPIPLVKINLSLFAYPNTATREDSHHHPVRIPKLNVRELYQFLQQQIPLAANLPHGNKI